MADKKLEKNELTVTKIEEKKLDDNKLEEASGGLGIGDWLASTSEPSGDTPKWEVGRRVIYYYSMFNKEQKGTITAVSDKASGGLLHKQFLYTIEHDDGEVDKGVYESSIEKYI